MSKTSKKDGLVPIFTKKIRTRNGKIIYAHNYGLKAFCIWVKSPNQLNLFPEGGK